jgi:2,3-bisphosphoglycerate-dependent phosphoglycerate mutase
MINSYLKEVLMETRIYMVRHAESPFVFGQEQSRGLSETGMKDAQRVAELLQDVDIHCIVSSNYTRAIQTVQYLAEKNSLNIIEYEELRERPIKGLNYQAPWEELLVAIEKSFTDLDYALEGGETSREAQNRAIPIIEGVFVN